MRHPSRSRAFRPALTLLEMTVVICVLMVLIGIGLFSTGKIREWRMGRQAGETLRTVYTAQRMYLADHPTKPVVQIQLADLIPYFSGGVDIGQEPAEDGEGAIPFIEVEVLDGGAVRTARILVNQSPPVIDGYHGDNDPSGNPGDGLWDVGE